MIMDKDHKNQPTIEAVRVIGAAGFYAGLAGAAAAVVMIVWPPQVAPEVFSYPFDAVGLAVAQVFFSIQHLFLAALIGILPWTAAVGRSRLATTWLAVAAWTLVAFAVLELVVIPAADTVVSDPVSGLIGTGYGILSLLVGAALIVGGIGVVRKGGWTGAKRYLPLILGIFVYFPVLPSLMGPSFLGRLSIGAWVLLFGVLGWVLWHSGSQDLERSAAAGRERVAGS